MDENDSDTSSVTSSDSSDTSIVASGDSSKIRTQTADVHPGNLEIFRKKIEEILEDIVKNSNISEELKKDLKSVLENIVTNATDINNLDLTRFMKFLEKNKVSPEDAAVQTSYVLTTVAPEMGLGIMDALILIAPAASVALVVFVSATGFLKFLESQLDPKDLERDGTLTDSGRGNVDACLQAAQQVEQIAQQPEALDEKKRLRAAQESQANQGKQDDGRGVGDLEGGRPF